MTKRFNFERIADYELELLSQIQINQVAKKTYWYIKQYN